MKLLTIATALGFAACATTAFAQAGLATSSTIGGHNTIQQAPSGGRVGTGAGAGGSAAGNAQPTQEERAFEKHNSEVSTICKGC